MAALRRVGAGPRVEGRPCVRPGGRGRDRDRRRFEPLPLSIEADADLDRGIDARNLREAIVALPEPYREAVILCAIEDRSYEEAAAILDCAVGTIRSRLHRGKALLAERLTGTPSLERTANHG